MSVLVADKIKIKWLHECSEKTEWENWFLYDLEALDFLTTKQRLKLDEIYKKMRKNKGIIRDFKKKVFNKSYKPSPFCEEHGVSYDDVHDFDK